MKELEHILLAKDDEADALLVRRAIKTGGITACLHVVRDGQEAVDYLSGVNGFADRTKHPFPKVMLLDLNMPRLDGFEVLKIVRNKLNFTKLPVIVLTQSEKPSDIKRAYELGATSYFRKPDKLESLDEMIHVLHAVLAEVQPFSGLDLVRLCGTAPFMPYATIQPPFTLKFREMSKKELKDYFQWFFDVLPQRTSSLAEAVRESPGFETWQPDQTPGSLDALGNWFTTQVETRQRTDDEHQEIASRSAYPIEIPGDELANRTFSLAMDVGMYLSQVLLKNHPSLRWEQPFGNKKFIDYGQPVLVGFGAVPFNPVRMSVTMAYGLASKKETGKGLRDLYNIWSKIVRSN